MLIRFLNTLFDSLLWVKADTFFYFAIFGAFVYTLYINRGAILKKIRNIDSFEALIIGLLSGTGLIIRFIYLKTSAHITDSVWEYLEGARYFVEKGFIYKCYGPTFFECAGPSPVAHPAMYSLINGLLYKITGFNPTATVYMAFFFSIVTLPVAFLSISEYIGDKKSALIGTAVLSVIPLHVLSSGVLDKGLSVFSVLSSFVVLLACGLAIKRDESKVWALLLFSILFAVSLRRENLLLLPIVLIAIYLERNGGLNYLKRTLKNRKWLIILFLVLIVAPLKSVYNYWLVGGAASSSFSVGYLFQNIGHLKRTLFRFYSLPGLFVLLLISFALNSDKKKTFVGVIWFLAFFVLYSFFMYGYTDRYMMNTLPPLVLLAAVGWQGLKNKLRSLIDIDKELFGKIIALVIAIFLLCSLSLVDYRRGRRKGNIDKLLAFSNYVDNKPIVFPDTNTLLAYFCYTSNRPAGTTRNVEILREYGYSEFYFLENFRCEGKPYEPFIRKGKVVKRIGNWKLYHINQTDQRFSVQR